MFILIGGGRNGKGVTLQVLTKMMGDENVVSIPPPNLWKKSSLPLRS